MTRAMSRQTPLQLDLLRRTAEALRERFRRDATLATDADGPFLAVFPEAGAGDDYRYTFWFRDDCLEGILNDCDGSSCPLPSTYTACRDGCAWTGEQVAQAILASIRNLRARPTRLTRPEGDPEWIPNDPESAERTQAIHRDQDKYRSGDL
jgi:hypothetical protein